MATVTRGASAATNGPAVWDPVVRLFHWGTVALVAGAFLTEDWRSAHIPIGYAILALIVTRILWGFVGTRHARFGDFVRGPRTVISYVRSLRAGTPQRYIGHNPAGGAMVVVLLGLLLATGGTGWLSETDRFFGNEIVSGLHSALSSVLLVAVALHVLGVIVSSRLHRENLLWAMITGRKRATLAGERHHEHGPAPGTRLYPR